MRVRISSEALTAVRAHAAAAPDLEVCGLLYGAPDRIARAAPATNVAADPARHFEIDPAALFAAIRAERGGGPVLIGYYHSHPRGLAVPSATDRAMAARDGNLWLIVAGEEVAIWRSNARGFEPVPILIDTNPS